MMRNVINNFLELFDFLLRVINCLFDRGNVIAGPMDYLHVGDARMDLKRENLVLLLKQEHRVWKVEDVATGRTYRVWHTTLGETLFNEMEVMAWAAR